MGKCLKMLEMKWDREDVFPTSADSADILDVTDFSFDHLYFGIFWIPALQIPVFPYSRISRFLGFSYHFI